MSSSVATAAEAEIWIVPFFGQGHLFLCIELCNQIASRNYKSTLIIPSHISATSTIPFSFFEVPIVGFFTSGACSAAVECAMWQARIQGVKPGEGRLLPGLPQDMALFESNLKHRPHGPPPSGPLEAGDQPHWMKEVEGSMALMFNTCDGLEGPFINYLANQLGKPVWGVGSLLPEQFYKSAGSKLHDHEMRTNRRSSNMTEDEIVDPTLDEYLVLANALEASNRPFILVIQGGAGRLDPLRHLDKPAEGSYFRSGLDNKVGKKGLIIDGWAPQSLILNHQSTSGFLSHCGWNSTVEAIGCRVPILAWPIRGDQHYNAKFVINHLKDDIVSGIEKLMSDQEIKKRAHVLHSIFNHGFPLSSVASLNAFIGLINHKSVLEK
ncbi:hypothetical protein CICLE_v10003109mg [Citrus x clementina]|uniref:Uncharacterized protein n=2 Tax=Citrus TaxID=2706 RepID=A0ACB8KFC5_CITSI|nr:hypothetical protein CICLE_v10003109mg [Citrus x clementina]KAH9753108.1 hypothetical protein KPL71_014961 [Citrus sinensis]